MIGIYARVSTEDQVRNGYSLQDQIRECKKKAGSGEVLEYIDEGISGEYLDRPALSELRNKVREGLITKVICLDPDRLSRKLMNQLIVSDEIGKRAELIFVNGEYQETPEGVLFYQMRGAISEFERAKITERFCRGRKQKARQGKVVRDYKIYGYDYCSDTGQLIINKDEADIVNIIFKLFTEKSQKVSGINGIAKYLTSQGIPTKKGALVWHRQVVRQILLNRTYIGEFYQNRWNTEGMLGNKFKDNDERISVRKRPREEWIFVSCPAIVDKDIFEYAQKLLQESRRRWAGVTKNKYLLSGLVRCGECGNTMTGRRSKNWGKYTLEYVDLKNTAGAKNKGCGKKVKMKELDSLVWDTVLNWLYQPDVISSELEDSENLFDSYEEAEINRINKRLSEIPKGRKNLIALCTNGSPSEADIKEIQNELTRLNGEEKELKERLLELENQKGHMELIKKQHYLFKEALEYYLSKAPEEITTNDKQDIIQHLIREVRVYDNEVKIFAF